MLLAQADTDPATAAEEDAGSAAEEHEGALIEAVDDAHGEDYHATPVWLAAEVILLAALIVMFAIIWRPAKRAVLGGLDARAEKIRNELDEAYRLKEEAQAALAAYQRKQRDALEEAERIVAHAHQEAERLRSHAAQALEEQLQRREAQAMERIAQAERAAAAEVRDAAVDAAVAASRAVIADTLDADTAGRLVDDAIAELPKKLAG